tara:strand:+ start:20751 stop:21005 length:255 start_codon:yes stop_codon:yes gene_type:complete
VIAITWVVVHNYANWCTALIEGIIALAAKTIRTSVMLPEKLHRQVQAISLANDVSVAWVVRQAVANFVSEQSGQVELPLGLDHR